MTAGPVAVASAQVPDVEAEAVFVVAAEGDQESEDSGNTTKWLLLSAGAGLALGGVIAGVQAFLRRRNEPRDKQRYGR